MSLIRFQQQFKDEQACIDWLIYERFGSRDNISCPYCDNENVYKFKNRKTFKCKSCHRQFSIRIGTIFEGSNVPLLKWFHAIYLFTSLKKGISSIQLSKYIEVTQKTAWFMLQRIRVAMEENLESQFEGISEIDEVYIGGRAKMKNKMSNKTVVVGIVNRERKEVIARKVRSAKTRDLQPIISQTIKGGSVIITDQWRAYNNLKYNYEHQKINHSKEFVRTDSRLSYKIHTNTIEGFWSHLKRGIHGTYHWASRKHMNKYLFEFSYRYNKRGLDDYSRFSQFFQLCNRNNLSY